MHARVLRYSTEKKRYQSVRFNLRQVYRVTTYDTESERCFRLTVKFHFHCEKSYTMTCLVAVNVGSEEINK